jgi:hypothetical protein
VYYGMRFETFDHIISYERKDLKVLTRRVWGVGGIYRSDGLKGRRFCRTRLGRNEGMRTLGCNRSSCQTIMASCFRVGGGRKRLRGGVSKVSS